LYDNQTRQSHAKQLAEIRDQDQEMSATVARLGEEEEAILVELERLGGLFQVFVEHIDPNAEGVEEAATEAESSSEDQRRSLLEEMLALIIRIRMHEKSLQTWFVEAFQRDRGVAD
jgi:hypothetical protein